MHASTVALLLFYEIGGTNADHGMVVATVGVHAYADKMYYGSWAMHELICTHAVRWLGLLCT
jgi:hypothetical protein